MQTNPYSIKTEMFFLTTRTGVNNSECILTSTFCVSRMICEAKIFGKRLYIAGEIPWVIPSQLSQCYYGHHLRFCSKNCTKCAFVRAMKNPQVSDQNSKRFKFYGHWHCTGHNPFLLSWIRVCILEGVWKPITSFVYKLWSGNWYSR